MVVVSNLAGWQVDIGSMVTATEGGERSQKTNKH